MPSTASVDTVLVTSKPLRGPLTLMNRFSCFLYTVLCCGLFFSSASAQTSGRLVELEVYSTPVTPTTMQHQWLEALSEVGADRVSAKTARRPSPSVEETTYGGTKVILVKGVINNRKIKLPKKTFSITDKRGIKAYLQSLRADGAKTTLAEKKAFGLTSEQLVDVHSKLSAVVSSSSKDEQSGSLITQFVQSLPLRTNLSPSARTAMRSEQKVSNEYQGLSTGTALSIELRLSLIHI